MGKKKIIISPSQLVGYSNLKSKATEPSEYYSGEGSLMVLCDKIISDGAKRIFVTADRSLFGSDVLNAVRMRLRSRHVSFFLYARAPHYLKSSDLKKTSKLFRQKRCDSILCIGGYDSMNFSKLLSYSVLSSKPAGRKNVSQSYYSKHIPFYAAPSTDCRGQESTLFAKVYNEKTKKYISVCVNKTLPSAAALDPAVSTQMHPDSYETALAGMDALSAAIESYISIFSEKFTLETQKAPTACRMIFDNLYAAFLLSENQTAIMALLKAFHYSGTSMRHAGAGYIHSLASRLEELYSVHHGIGSAVLLPVVLEYYLPDSSHDLSMLAYYCKFTENKSFENENAAVFINEIKKLRRELGINNRISIIRKEDYKTIIERTQKEARLQGCPKLLSDKQLAEILDRIS